MSGDRSCSGCPCLGMESEGDRPNTSPITFFYAALVVPASTKLYSIYVQCSSMAPVRDLAVRPSRVQAECFAVGSCPALAMRQLHEAPLLLSNCRVHGVDVAPWSASVTQRAFQCTGASMVCMP